MQEKTGLCACVWDIAYRFIGKFNRGKSMISLGFVEITFDKVEGGYRAEKVKKSLAMYRDEKDFGMVCDRCEFGIYFSFDSSVSLHFFSTELHFNCLSFNESEANEGLKVS